MALEIDDTLHDAYHGYALCQFKSGHPDKSLAFLDKVIKMLDDKELKNRSDYGLFYFRYLRSLCYRAMSRFPESERDYHDLVKIFDIQEGNRISKKIMAMIIMPLEKERKKILLFVD
jgi:tetratricopeptide (TPR) repeat protein